MAAKGKPVFTYELCVACGICMHACAFGSIEMSNVGVDKLKKAYPALDHPDTCTGCAQCEQQCPAGIITMKT
jgi:NAD-dependent dihydropyrimidine dehydrogenase PreA subunit